MSGQAGSPREESWPPPPSPADRHRRVPVAQGGGKPALVELRAVRLWGREVLVDDESAVWCSGCWRLVPVEELGRPDNGHRAGLPYRADGMLLPPRDDPSPSPPAPYSERW